MGALPKSSDEKDVSSSGSSHCAPGDQFDVGDRSEGFKVPVVHWNQIRNKSQGIQHGQEESENHEVGQDRSCNLPRFQACCRHLSNGPGRFLHQNYNSREDEDNAASHAVKSKDADNESTDVDHNEAEDVDDTGNDRDNKADRSSNSTRGLNKMDGKCSSSEDDPRKLDGKSSYTTNYIELQLLKEPSGTRSPIISNDLIVARGKGVVDSEVPVLNGDNDDAGVCAIMELVFPPDHTRVYFRQSPLDVRHKSQCAAQTRSDLIQ